MSYRKLPLERIQQKLARGEFRGKLQSADYANTGIQPFDLDTFAGQLDIGKRDLILIGLVQISEQSGWKLPQEPPVDRFVQYMSILRRLRGEEAYGR